MEIIGTEKGIQSFTYHVGNRDKIQYSFEFKSLYIKNQRCENMLLNGRILQENPISLQNFINIIISCSARTASEAF